MQTAWHANMTSSAQEALARGSGVVSHAAQAAGAFWRAAGPAEDDEAR